MSDAVEPDEVGVGVEHDDPVARFHQEAFEHQAQRVRVFPEPDCPQSKVWRSKPASPGSAPAETVTSAVFSSPSSRSRSFKGD